ncbi:hypothetical protein ACSBR1_030917 [Camellia fascicularis]
MESSEIEVLSRNRSDSSERFRSSSQQFRSVSAIQISKSKFISRNFKILSSYRFDFILRFKSEFISLRFRFRSEFISLRFRFRLSISAIQIGDSSEQFRSTLRRQSSGEEVGSRGTECSSNPSKLH